MFQEQLFELRMRKNAECSKAILKLGEEMGQGEQRSGELCPYCDGGAQHEKSLSVIRTPYTVMYTCHRASCRESGALTLSKAALTNTPRPAPLRPQTGSAAMLAKFHLQPLNEEQREMLLKKYYITFNDIEAGCWSWAKDQDRLFMPILGIAGYAIGGVARTLNEGVKPKTYTLLTDPDQVTCCYYGSRNVSTSYRGNTLWMVEDQISAMRLSRYTNALALLGCGVSEPLIGALKVTSFKHIILALDKDAFDKSLIFKKKYGELFESFVVKKLDRDIKDMKPGDLKDLLYPPKLPDEVQPDWWENHRDEYP